jgi:hypothetical protein
VEGRGWAKSWAKSCPKILNPVKILGLAVWAWQEHKSVKPLRHVESVSKAVNEGRPNGVKGETNVLFIIG